MGKKTPLYDCHLHAQAKIVDFAGWDMPLHYGSQIQEHHQVRQESGVFDVSHMTIVDLHGQEASNFLRYLLANNVDRLVKGKALYSCMLNDEGGVIDDLIVYKMSDDFYRLVVNSGTREKDLAWLNKQISKFKVSLEVRDDLAMVAIQGPQIRNKIPQLFDTQHAETILGLKIFHSTSFDDFFVARTGYTGEDGFEIILPATEASSFWKKITGLGIKPCGLGARDTLRLEAGLNLYGSDMDEKVTPLESNLAWTVALEPASRDFIGRKALEKQLQQGVKMQLVGLVLESQGVLRNHQKVLIEGEGSGEITSGSFSPTLNKGIALARIPVTNQSHCSIEMRGKAVLAQIIKPPFVRQGKKTFSNIMERENE